VLCFHPSVSGEGEKQNKAIHLRLLRLYLAEITLVSHIVAGSVRSQVQVITDLQVCIAMTLGIHVPVIVIVNIKGFPFIQSIGEKRRYSSILRCW
jgi:hypothetical protein